jgi:hypothetical protein
MPDDVTARRPARVSGRPARPSIFDDEQSLSDLVSRIYSLERRLLESMLTGQPSTYTPSPSLGGRVGTLEAKPVPSTWSKLARFLIEVRIRPTDYITRQFDQYRSLSDPLYPNKLLGDEAWKRYTDSKTTKQDDLRVRLRSFTSALRGQGGSSAYVTWPKTREGRDAAVEGCLSVLYCDESISPLFAYCVAANVAQNYPAYADDAEKLLRRSELPAAIEYLRFRADYDAVWATLIPAGFRPRAERIYRDILRRLF